MAALAFGVPQKRFVSSGVSEGVRLSMEVTGDACSYNEREYDDDYYTQAGKLWRLMPDDEKRLTCENTARAMEGVPLFIKQCHVRACHNADPQYGSMLADALGIDLQEALTAEDPAHPSWDKRKPV